MSLEIEAKLKVDSHDPVREALRVAGARFIDRVVETNHILDTPDRQLVSGGQGLRVRVAISQEGRAPRASMTFKGKRQPGDLKSREEIEVEVGDAGQTIRLLGAIGFEPVFVFQKRRESWRLEPCQVELDEVPHLGHYVEIEGPDEAAIASAQAALGLADLPPIQSGYIALLTEYCRDRNLPTGRVVFGD